MKKIFIFIFLIFLIIGCSEEKDYSKMSKKKIYKELKKIEKIISKREKRKKEKNNNIYIETGRAVFPTKKELEKTAELEKKRAKIESYYQEWLSQEKNK